MKLAPFILSLCLLGLSRQSFAIEYYELEVYGYNLASRHEIEIENATSASSNDKNDFSGRIFRSTMEFNYGWMDHLEVATYLDYTEAFNQFEYTAFRSHLRTNFFEKGERPVDMGAYVEMALPRNFRQTDLALEFKAIFEKDISRWTVAWNPGVELAHTNGDTDDVVVNGDTDEGINTVVVPREKSWQVNWQSAMSVRYNWGPHLRPHLDWHTSLTDGTSLLLPNLDFKVANIVKTTLGVGFGLNSLTEQRLINLRVEYEM